MINKYCVAVFIPAKGSSKGIPEKNLKVLKGKPLLMHTVEAAKSCKYIDVISIGTEDSRIGEIGKKEKIEVVYDPEPPTETNPLDPVYEHCIKELEKRGHKIDIVILLQPTSPLRNSKHIDEALEKFLMEKADSLLSATKSHKFLWKIGKDGAYPVNYDYKKRPLRQEREQEYAENGAIYITWKDALYKTHCRLSGKIVLYIMEDKNIEIDEPDDFFLIEKMMETEHGKD